MPRKHAIHTFVLTTQNPNAVAMALNTVASDVPHQCASDEHSVRRESQLANISACARIKSKAHTVINGIEAYDGASSHAQLHFSWRK